jgi:uncharacterized RDD family membrane protein YckC
MQKASKLDTSVTIVTPENIEFSYRLAGPFRRLAAAVVDLFIKFSLLAIWIVSLLILGASFTFGGIISFVILVSWFLIDWFYGIIWETMWSGQTPGKRLFSLRVISCEGRPISAVQATLRNLLRVADLGVPASIQIFSPDLPPGFLFPTFSVGLAAMTLTKRFQRIGDLAADTMVIVEERAWQPLLLKIDDPRASSLVGYIPPDFIVPLTMAKALSLYVAKRSLLPPARRTELANHLAKPLIEKFGFMPDTSPDLMLCALYLHAFYSTKQSDRERATGISPYGKMGSAQAAIEVPPTSTIATPVIAGGMSWESLGLGTGLGTESRNIAGADSQGGGL